METESLVLSFWQWTSWIFFLMSIFWKSLEENNQIFLPVKSFFVKWLNPKISVLSQWSKITTVYTMKMFCFTRSWKLNMMNWGTLPAPIPVCLTIQIENLIQLCIIRKCLFHYCAKWMVLVFFFFSLFFVHFVCIHLEYLHFMAEWDKSDICFTYFKQGLVNYFLEMMHLLQFLILAGFEDFEGSIQETNQFTAL